VQPLEALNSATAIDINYIGDGGWPFEITVWRNGQKAEQYHANGPLGIVRGHQYDVDVYLSRTRLRILLDGNQVHDQPLPDLGFDRGYVSFAQLAYNPVKDGYPGQAGNRFLWDNLSFDGPSLPKNSLTPADKQDVLFRAFNKSSCTVRGLAADGPINPSNNWIFDTWHVRLDVNAAPVTLGDIQCVARTNDSAPFNNPAIGDIEVIKR
jgi:hypothetical protein